MEVFIILESIAELKLYHLDSLSDQQMEIVSEANGQYINSNADEYSAAMKVWDACNEDNHSGNNPMWEGIWADSIINPGEVIDITDGLFICQTGAV
jgi:hypothetical protein|tara:strand:+ start:232 stop:519 length:288 start_codon:yes stop_codon:yes gene_type:complete